MTDREYPVSAEAIEEAGITIPEYLSTLSFAVPRQVWEESQAEVSRLRAENDTLRKAVEAVESLVVDDGAVSVFAVRAALSPSVPLVEPSGGQPGNVEAATAAVDGWRASEAFRGGE